MTVAPQLVLDHPVRGTEPSALRLGDVLRPRQETPGDAEVAMGQIPIVAKIGFASGQIELRGGTDTKTKLILVRPGDLLVSGINAAKGAIAIHPRDATGPIAATIHYGAYEVDTERADPSYLWWLLRSNFFKDVLRDHVPGGIKTELKPSRLLPVPVPLPPLKEQQRIVAKIERLAAKIEEAQATRRLAIVEAKALLRAHLRVLGSRLGCDGTLSRVLGGKPRNGWSARCDNADGGTPVLTLSAVTGYEYDPTAIKRTSLPTVADAHYWLRPGDLLITRSNTPQLVGHAAIYDGRPERCIYPDLMMRVPVDPSAAHTRFVWFWLQTSQVREFIIANAKGTSPTMKKISQGTVMAIPFPRTLGLQEQTDLARELDQVQERCHDLAQLHHRTTGEIDALLPCILDKAFKGEL